MKKLLAAAISLAVVATASAPAFADTYAVVINGLKDPINLGGSQVPPGLAAWTPLNATIALPNGKFANIMDLSLKTNDGGWMIQSIATLPSFVTVRLGFAEVGCIAALVNNAGTEAAPLYRIDMQQMPGGRCADQWWNGSGKDTIKQAMEWYHTSQKNAIEALGVIAK